MEKYNFGGWATCYNMKCSDGLTIKHGAFDHCNGKKVPLVWHHQVSNPKNILGYVVLEAKQEGVYSYGFFNETESGKDADIQVRHGDVCALSICANRLRKDGSNVVYGDIKEVSLVTHGANPGAFIDTIVYHEDLAEEEAIIYNDREDQFMFYHEDTSGSNNTGTENKPKNVAELFEQAIDKLSKEEQDAVYAVVGMALETEEMDDKESKEAKHDDISEEGEDVMKHNAFEKNEVTSNDEYLTHADQQAIIKSAKTSAVGSFRSALNDFVSSSTITHNFDEDGFELLFPDYKDVKPGAPDLLERDMAWVASVMNGVHKSPISRIRTRQADARAAELRAKGYNNRETAKSLSGNIKMLSRTTDPQTVYRKDELHRDDIIDITDFDVVAYQYGVMRRNLEEDIALAILVGDGREDGDADKISEDHVRSIWHDDELYTIHTDVDIEAASAELQGTNTGAYFGQNYIYAEAIIAAALYSREKYKGRGNLDFYCTPHLLNVMLLARDLNGRRIYSSKNDLAAALNVRSIHTVEQFEGLTRTTDDGKTKKLLGLFVNLADYHVGATRGGQITRFDDFDIDFNKYKYLIEARMSGALTKVASAIALEEPVTEDEAG